jgi:hypothetical protein
VDNIRINLGEVGWVTWTDLSGPGYEQVEGSCEFDIEPWVPYNVGKLSSGVTTGGLSSSAQYNRSLLFKI